jgi:hypothetical protein
MSIPTLPSGAASELCTALRALLAPHGVHLSEHVAAAVMPGVIASVLNAIAGQPKLADEESSCSGREEQRAPQPPPPRPDFPDWFNSYIAPPHHHNLLLLPEWCDSSYRLSNGWHGLDYVHASSSPARVAAYALIQPPPAPLTPTASPYPSLIGIAHFTPACESHKRFCHGAPPRRRTPAAVCNAVRQAVQRARSSTTRLAGWAFVTLAQCSRGPVSRRK